MGTAAATASASAESFRFVVTVMSPLTVKIVINFLVLHLPHRGISPQMSPVSIVYISLLRSPAITPFVTTTSIALVSGHAQSTI